MFSYSIFACFQTDSKLNFCHLKMLPHFLLYDFSVDGKYFFVTLLTILLQHTINSETMWGVFSGVL